MPDCRIYLADIVHNYAAKGPFTFPLNVGYLASYLRKLYGPVVEVEIFKFPGELMDALERRPPHILGLGNYTWNLRFNCQLSRWVKERMPKTVTVFGGPDYPVMEQRALDYVRARPEVDFFVIHQGEPGLANLVQRWLEFGSPEAMKSEPIENCVYLASNGGSLVGPGQLSFIQDLSQIPSPYLTGELDAFFTGGLIPIIETNRGCPYTCTYCAWGASAQHKVFKFPLERIKQELDYIADQPQNSGLLMIGDANFGIFSRDLEVALHLRELKNRTGFPSYVEIAWAKRTPDRILEMAELLKDMASVTCSFQTLDPKVRKNIKRVNLSLEEFRDIQDHFFSQGVPSHTELILGLPEETKETHLNALRSMFETNVWFIECYNLRMLDGSELATQDSRQLYELEVKYRLVDGGFGEYHGLRVVEHEEMVVSTNTMTFEDVLFFRPIHFFITFLWNYRYYADILLLMRSWGINPADFIVRLVEESIKVQSKAGELMREYLRESREEWYSNPEELHRHYETPEGIDFLASGGFGKLNYKYMWRFLLECRPAFNAMVMDTARGVIGETGRWGAEEESQLKAVMSFLDHQLVDFSRGMDEIQDKKTALIDYDLLAWRKDSYSRELTEYAQKGLELIFRLPEGQLNTLHGLFNQFRQPTLNQTLRKMVEYMNKRQLLYEVDYA